MIYVSIIGLSGMPDKKGVATVLDSTLEIAVWVKSKMAAICPRSNTQFVSL